MKLLNPSVLNTIVINHFACLNSLGMKSESHKSHTSRNPMNLGNRGASFAPLG